MNNIGPYEKMPWRKKQMERECWVLYYTEDYKKNKRFVELITNRLEKENILTKLVLLNNQNIDELLKKNTPEIVINRSRNYEIAEKMERAGIKVINSSFVTKIANDKLYTYKFLKNKIEFMPLLEKDKEYPYIIKSRNGHGGNQVYLVHNELQRQEVLTQLEGESYICQEYCNEPGKDLRVYVMGGDIVTAMLRQSKKGFKSNYSLGGSAQEYILSAEEKDIVYKILDMMNIDYGGIDFIFHNGKLMFNEIEDAVGARMVYENTEIDIVGLFADYIVEKVSEGAGM